MPCSSSSSSQAESAYEDLGSVSEAYCVAQNACHYSMGVGKQRIISIETCRPPPRAHVQHCCAYSAACDCSEVALASSSQAWALAWMQQAVAPARLGGLQAVQHLAPQGQNAAWLPAHGIRLRSQVQQVCNRRRESASELGRL